MSRAELHGIVANLKRYLEWQGEFEDDLGIPPAPAALQEAFEARKAERERARLEAARGAITDEPQRAEPPKPAATGEQAAEPEFTRPQAASPKPAAEEKPAGGDKPWVKYGPRARKTFGSGKPEPAQPEPPQSEDPAPTDYDGPPLEEPDYDESYGGYDETPAAKGPGFPPHGAGNLAAFDASRFGWHGGKFRSPPEPEGGFDAADKLAILRMYLGDCTRCGLCEGRTNIVFGDGSPSARIMFIGEGPGYNEDKQAKPFVGKAGQLLDKMIVAMGYSRETVYIANVVKCRPPDNRDPAPDEVVSCSPFLHKQIDAIQPEIIVTLGKFAAQNLLGVDTPISKMRGQWHEFKGIPVMPTWHPAYLLRNQSEKGATWGDLKQVMGRLSGGS